MGPASWSALASTTCVPREPQRPLRRFVEATPQDRAGACTTSRDENHFRVGDMSSLGGLGDEVPLDSTDGVSSLSFAPLAPLLLATSWDGVRVPPTARRLPPPTRIARSGGAAGGAWCRGCACTRWALTGAYAANFGKRARSSAALSWSPGARCWQAGWTRISSGGCFVRRIDTPRNPCVARTHLSVATNPQLPTGTT